MEVGPADFVWVVANPGSRFAVGVVAAGVRREIALYAAPLDTLGKPRDVTLTPGNHDAPYLAPFERVFLPFRRFERHVGPAPYQSWRKAGVGVRGINTARGALIDEAALVEGVRSGGGEPTLDREPPETVFAGAGGGLGHRTSPLGAAFRGSCPGSSTGRTDFVATDSANAVNS